MSEMAKDLVAILPLILTLITAVVALVCEMLRRPTFGLVALCVGMGAATALAATKLGMDATAFSRTYRVDELSVWAVLILCPFCALSALMVRSELAGRPREGTVYALLCFGTVGSLALAGSGDLMFIVLGVLMNGLAGFALAAQTKSDPATEGALKYFVYGSVTGAVMVFGLAYWVGLSGSTLIADLQLAQLNPIAFAFGFVCLTAGVGYAVSLFPFHFWTPDTFEGAPASIAAFLSVTPKIGGFFALAQVMRALDGDALASPLLLALFAALSMTFGNLLALRQENVIRLLAYSTVAQAGYYLLGVVAIGRSLWATPSLIVFSLAYAAMNLGAFAIALAHGRDRQRIAGLGRRHPFAAVAMALFLFSLVGIPPLAGFAGKFMLFGAAIDSGYTWLAVIGILNSALALAVYLRVIYPMFFRAAEGDQTSVPQPRLNAFVWLACLAVTLVGGVGLRLLP